VPGQLQEEEGVASGFPLKFAGHRGLAFGEELADCGLQQTCGRVTLKPPQRQAPAIDVACQRWQGSRQLAVIEFNVAVHGHGQKRRGTPGPHQMLEQQEGGPVRPVQVVENE
jgi:hypothetical protein